MKIRCRSLTVDHVFVHDAVQLFHCFAHPFTSPITLRLCQPTKDRAFVTERQVEWANVGIVGPSRFKQVSGRLRTLITSLASEVQQMMMRIESRWTHMNSTASTIVSSFVKRRTWENALFLYMCVPKPPTSVK